MMGPMLPIWEDTMPPLPADEIAAVGQRIAFAMNDDHVTV
jgi:hypothetical protein